MPEPTCSISGCGKPAFCRGWCGMHYARWVRNGTTELQPKLTTEERFWKYVLKSDDPDDCWLWLGAQNGGGYGAFKPGHAKMMGAHRFSYMLLVGAIPTGLVIDHLCCNPSCVNPRHLEAVSDAENLRRGLLMSSRNRRKSKCKSGHWLIGSNVILRAGGGRKCRTCARIAEAKDPSRVQIPPPAERHGARPANPCRKCDQREVEIEKHGMCQFCFVEAQLERARDMAATIPILEQLYAELSESRELYELVA